MKTTILLRGLCACLLTLLTLPVASAAQSDEKPNVVLILIDDLGHYGVTAYGANQIGQYKGAFEDRTFATPNIDRIAANGLRCDNAFAYPLCEPTRIALMSGQYNSRDFLRPKSQHESEITFGDTFKKAGYATGIFGKWKQSRGTAEVPGKNYITRFGWDEHCCFDVVTAGQRYINPDLVINGEIENYKGRKDLDPATGRRWYGPDICNRMALDFISAHKDEPFFLYYPMILVHDEHKPTPDTVPHSLFDSVDESMKVDQQEFFPDMIAYMDKLIGKVVARLEAEGLLENTLLIVIGDNGTKENFVHILPDGTRYPGGKGATQENGLHVPLVMSWPGKIPTDSSGQYRAYDGLVDVTDIYPTISEAVGVPLPPQPKLDGISFWKQAAGAPGEARDVIYTWYNGNHKADDLADLRRYAFNKNFKRYAPHPKFPKGRFFDLRKDRLEQSGEKSVKISYFHTEHSGLDLDQLDETQRAAYEMLGEVIDAHAIVPVSSIEITQQELRLKKGATAQLEHTISPGNATRRNVIWESSDSSVATVDKFGVVTGKSPGSARVTMFSWDDASPRSDGKGLSYRREGLSDSVLVEVLEK
ncbi:sulfatase-like hydrolase/transferase [Luteolibacter algae]|uniref:Sulfatase-like hydrolase/transferase n=1 Tax=Luteolibacter algae TaxID=454151 RepID=A0ABW5D615_9BACT